MSIRPQIEPAGRRCRGGLDGGPATLSKRFGLPREAPPLRPVRRQLDLLGLARGGHRSAQAGKAGRTRAHAARARIRIRSAKRIAAATAR